VVALNTAANHAAVRDRLDLAEVGIAGSRDVYDWRRRERTLRSTLDAELDPRDWALWVVAPEGERADAGDPTKYVTVESDLDR
jgi:hypothetical protein